MLNTVVVLVKILGSGVEGVDDLSHAGDCLQGSGVGLVNIAVFKHYQHALTLI